MPHAVHAPMPLRARAMLWAAALAALCLIGSWMWPSAPPPSKAAWTASTTANPLAQAIEARWPLVTRDATDVSGVAAKASTVPTELPLPPAACADVATGTGSLLTSWITAMQSAADERVRAAGWLIAWSAGEAANRDRLATWAASSSDPVVQAYAQRACRSDAESSSACLALPPQAWARVEPDNAAAWLALAADPRADEAMQIDALRRAAQARRFDSHMPRLQALAAATLPRDAGPRDRLAMAAQVDAARGDWLATEALRQHCGVFVSQDAGMRNACAALADLLQSQAQTLPDLLQARELGARLGWPADRLDALRDDEARLAGARRRWTDVDDPTDCAVLTVAADFADRAGERGEVAALRQALDDGLRP